MNRLICTGLALLLLGATAPSAYAGDVAIYTGSTSWIGKADADAQAQICVDKLTAWGITATWISDAANAGDLATWMTARTGDGAVDVVILYGAIPGAIYPNPNVNPDGSVAELFIESTDGDAIINHGDWMFYVSPGGNNADLGLKNIMDVATVTQNHGDNTPMVVTDAGKEIASSLGNFWSDRMFRPDQLTGDWVVEAALAQNYNGVLVEPAILRDGDRGRVVAAYQTNGQLTDPKGAVGAEIASWLIGADRGAATAAGIKALKPASWANEPIELSVRLLETTGSATAAAVDTTVDLSSDSGTGVFDIAPDGAFDGSVTSVTIPAGATYVDVYYQDTTGGTPTLTAAVAGLTSGTQQVSVSERTFATPGEVAIYTGRVGWVTKGVADAQADLTAAKLANIGVTPTLYKAQADEAALATWVQTHTNDGQLDVLVLYGFFPPTIYPPGNTSPDGSIAELFIESEDGDAIINHGDAMFYVTDPCCNTYTGLQNMLDIPGFREDSGDVTMAVTPEGAAIAPSFYSFPSPRAFFLDMLQGNWLVEAAIGLSAEGHRADPVIIRDGNRGRIIPALQRSDDSLPKGAVSADIITWLYGENPSEPVQFALVGRPYGGVEQPLKFSAQVQGLTGSPAKVEADTVVDLSSDSGTGVFDTAPDGAFDGSVTSVLIPAGAATATFFYKDSAAGTPTLTASAAGFASADLPIEVVGRSFATPGEVAIYTGKTWWVSKAAADLQAEICANRLADAAIPSIRYLNESDQAALATWVGDKTDNGELDVLVLYGCLPRSIYPTGNTQPDGSLAELFIESTDGDTIINHGDWMFYVDYDAADTRLENGPGGLQSMMDLPGIGQSADNTPMFVTTEGRTIAPSLPDFLSDRVFFTDQLAGDWYAEAIIAQSADGSRLEPAIVRDGDRGRLVAALQTNSQDYDPKGAVAAEIIAWLMGTQLVPTQIGIDATGADVAVQSKAVQLKVSLQDPSGVPSPAEVDVAIDLASDTATGKFDTSMTGSFDGSVTSVTIPAGETTAIVYYKDSAAGVANLSATDAAAGLTAGALALNVLAYVPILPGEVAIYTGDVGWTTKEEADVQAQICVDALTTAGITSTWYASNADKDAVAAWVTAATNNGLTDVLVLYGYLPETIYAPGNTETDGSLVELFIESTDGDTVINHADWMFYVTTPCCNGEAGLQNIMDIPGFTLWGDDTPMVVTDVGEMIAPSLNDFWSDRAFRYDLLAGDWFVEAALAQDAFGTRADPVIVRDGNRGRLVPMFQAASQADPKGAVAAETIQWILDQSTGELGGLMKPMDMNGDGGGDLSDAVALLNHLFLGADGPPCATNSVNDAANIALLDSNGDDGIDLSDAVHWLNFLFLGGPPSSMCTDGACAQCILIPDCPDLCEP